MRRIWLFCFLLLLTGCASAPAPASFAPAEADRLVLYTSHAEEIYGPLVREFEERTGVWIQVETGGTGTLLDRIAAEAEAPVCDLLLGGGVDSIQSRAELFAPYESPLAGELREDCRCPDGTWTAFSSLPVMLIYNPVLVRSNPPESWASLLDPAWKGKIAFASPTASGASYTALAALLQILPGDDQEMLTAFFRNLDGRELETSSEVVGEVDAVAGGASCIGVVPEDAALRAMESGRDIALLCPAEGTCCLPDGMAVVAGCAHEDNARRFIDFVLSAEVQRYLAEHCFRRSVRADLSPAEPDFQVFAYDAAWASDHRDQLLAQWQALRESGEGRA